MLDDFDAERKWDGVFHPSLRLKLENIDEELTAHDLSNMIV